MRERNTKIIELVGIPGCGKTTSLTKSLYSFSHNGIRVFDLNRSFQTDFRFLFTYIKAKTTHNKQTHSTRKAWRDYCNCIKEIPFSVRFKIQWFENLQFLTCLKTIGEIEGDYDVIISDQWIFQHAFSILHDKDLRNYLDVLHQLDESVYALFSGCYHVVVCDISLENCINRLSGRTNGQSVLDGLNKDKMKQICSQQISNLSCFTEDFLKCPCNHIDFNGTSEQCSNELFSIVNTIMRR